MSHARNLIPVEESTRPTLAMPSPSSASSIERIVARDALLAEEEHSYVGSLPSEPSPFETARRRHLAFVNAISELEAECADFDSYDLSAQAAQLSLRKRVGSLALTRNALEVVVEIAARDEALEGPIAPYLAGVYLWLDGVTDALQELARQLNVMSPNWSALRQTLGEVTWLYEMTLIEQARIEASDLFSGTALGEALEALSSAVVCFNAALEEPFG